MIAIWENFSTIPRMTKLLSIGVAGWSYPDWQRIVYPAGTKDPLAYLCRYVDCIEINSTFYRPPESRISHTWLSKIRHKAGFFFTAKLHQDFTHECRLDSSLIKDFHTGLAPLLETGQLRHLLMQFPYYFDDSVPHRSHLTELVKRFSPPFDLVVEVRHKSWESEDAMDFMTRLKVTVATIDCPAGPDSFSLPCCTVGKAGYFRLHGRNTEAWFKASSRDDKYNYCYNEHELTEIEGRIKALCSVFPSAMVITNNHYQGAAVANALELKARLTGQKQLVPEDLLLRYPRLKEIALNPPLF